MKAFLYTVFAAAVAISAVHAQSEQEAECGRRPNLTCFLIPTLSQTLEGEQSQVRGSMTLTPFWQNNQCYSRVTGVVTGLGDNTPHGIHIHELGDISAPDGTSTGGHYNPFGNAHALPDQGERADFHVGDLGNLFPDNTGRAEFDVLYSDPISTWALVGRSIVIHADQDQGVEAQPTGGAGARLSVCVLGTLSA